MERLERLAPMAPEVSQVQRVLLGMEVHRCTGHI